MNTNIIDRKKVIKLLTFMSESMIKRSEFTDLFKSDEYSIIYDSENIEDINNGYFFEGVSNGFISEILAVLFGVNCEVTGDIEKLYSCPCCGYRTLSEIYDSSKGTGYDICPYCGWEDIGRVEPDKRYSINGGSMNDYRNKIKTNSNRYYIFKWLKDD